MDYTIHTPGQLGQVLRGQRMAQGLTQKATGEPVGLLPKTVGRLEGAPARSSVESLFKLLSALSLELVIRPKSDQASEW